jgi:metallo-beta-lactamase class B
MAFPPVKSVRSVRDHETLRVGDLAVTAHFTPGHTPGSTTWTWRSCEGADGVDVVDADSLNAVSDDDFKFTSPMKPTSGSTFVSRARKPGNLRTRQTVASRAFLDDRRHTIG